MNIHLHNVNLQYSSGPNSFAQKLVKYSQHNGIVFDASIKPDAHLCFIETSKTSFEAPMFQRLDGIYFNTRSDYKQQNSNIRRTYEMADGVVFQSDFNRQLITKYFGVHSNSTIIHNGADLEMIESIDALDNSIINEYENVWCCASHWRPHKRLDENIRYFTEHAGPRDCLVVAGKTNYGNSHPRVFFTGDLPHNTLICLYKRAKYFIHLAWLDHCPNVVVDARASGCQIICSSAGGTKEIAGMDAVIVQENEWDFEPLDLYSPPRLDFSRKTQNTLDSNYDMIGVAKQYENFLTSTK